jgi:hypothetical protein
MERVGVDALIPPHKREIRAKGGTRLNEDKAELEQTRLPPSTPLEPLIVDRVT